MMHRLSIGTLIPCGAALMCSGPAAAGGDILWTYALEMDYPGTPLVAPSGVVLWAGTLASVGLGNGGINAVSPEGEMLWRWSEGGTNGVLSIAPDGGILAGDSVGGRPAIMKLSSMGELLWRHILPDMSSFIGGPDVGPDGNIYAVADIGQGTGYMISVTPEGNYRWQIDGFSARGGGNSHVVFSGNRLFKIEDRTPIPTGPVGSNAGLVAMTTAGGIDWYHQFNVGSTFAHRQPAVSPITGSLHVSSHNDMRSYRPDGTVEWESFVGFRGQGLGEPAVGRDGKIFAVHGNTSLVALDHQGSILWYRSYILPAACFHAPAVSHDGRLVAVTHSPLVNDSPPVPAHIYMFSAADGVLLWTAPLPVQPGGFPYPHGLAFSRDSSSLYIGSRSIYPYPQPPSGMAYLSAMSVGGC